MYLHKNLTLRIFERTTETEKMLQRFSAAQSSSGFLNYSIGITEVSVISSSAMDLALSKMCTIKPRTTIKNTHALTLRYKRSTRETSGVYYRVLKQLAFEDIPILELFSAGEELTLILHERNIARAFTLLNEMQ